ALLPRFLPELRKKIRFWLAQLPKAVSHQRYSRRTELRRGAGRGTCIPTMLRRRPTRSRRKQPTLPHSTIMDVPAWLKRGATGAAHELIRISSAPSSSVCGKKLLRFLIEGVGL